MSGIEGSQITGHYLTFYRFDCPEVVKIKEDTICNIQYKTKDDEIVTSLELQSSQISEAKRIASEMKSFKLQGDTSDLNADFKVNYSSNEVPFNISFYTEDTSAINNFYKVVEIELDYASDKFKMVPKLNGEGDGPPGL